MYHPSLYHKSHQQDQQFICGNGDNGDECFACSYVRNVYLYR